MSIKNPAMFEFFYSYEYLSIQRQREAEALAPPNPSPNALWEEAMFDMGLRPIPISRGEALHPPA
jgi:hypothetical protein